jgi:hypothetical protein
MPGPKHPSSPRPDPRNRAPHKLIARQGPTARFGTSGKMRSVQIEPAKTKKGVTTRKMAFVPKGQHRPTKK